MIIGWRGHYRHQEWWCGGVENNYKEDIKNYDVEDVVNDMEDVMNNTEDVKNNEMEKKWKVLISEFVEEIKELKSPL